MLKDRQTKTRILRLGCSYIWKAPESPSWQEVVDNLWDMVASWFGEGNGTPLQYSCLENPMDGGAWWAAVYGVAQSRTLLKRPSSSSSRLFYNSYPHKCKVTSHSFLVCISVGNSDIDQLSMFWLSICMFSLEKKCLFRSFAHFYWVVYFLYWAVWALYIFWILIPASDIICKYFIPFHRYLFIF